MEKIDTKIMRHAIGTKFTYKAGKGKEKREYTIVGYSGTYILDSKGNINFSLPVYICEYEFFGQNMKREFSRSTLDLIIK